MLFRSVSASAEYGAQEDCRKKERQESLLHSVFLSSLLPLGVSVGRGMSRPDKMIGLYAVVRYPERPAGAPWGIPRRRDGGRCGFASRPVSGGIFRKKAAKTYSLTDRDGPQGCIVHDTAKDCKKIFTCPTYFQGPGYGFPEESGCSGLRPFSSGSRPL